MIKKYHCTPFLFQFVYQRMVVQVSHSNSSKVQKKSDIYNQYRKDLQEIIRTLYKYKGIEITEGHMMPDHVHRLVSIPPKTSVA